MRRFCCGHDLVDRFSDRDARVHAGLEAALRRRRHRAEQHHGEQEHRRDRTVLGDAPVGIRKPRADESERHAVRIIGEMLRGRRKEVFQQTVLTQQVEGALAETSQEELLELVEQPRGRNVFEQPSERRKRRPRRFMDGEAELRLEAHGTKHPDRILAVARLGIADQPDRAGADVLDAADVIPDREVLDVVVQRVAGEVAAPDVLVDRAVDVVAKQAPVSPCTRSIDAGASSADSSRAASSVSSGLRRRPRQCLPAPSARRRRGKSPPR